MTEKRDDATEKLREELAQFRQVRTHDAQAYAARAQEEARKADEAAQPKDEPREREGTVRQRTDIVKRYRVPCFTVWISPLRSETLKYIEVQQSISASPTAIIIRTPYYTITGQGRGMYMLRSAIASEVVPELIIAEYDTTQEWALTSLRMFASDEVEAAISDDGKLVIAELTRVPEPA